MREILFRGKTPGGWWVYGDHIKDRIQTDGKPNEYIMIRFFNVFEGENFEYYEFIIPETLGQYTGLKDKNGKMIFEGDILKICEYGKTQNFVVLYEGGKFRLCFPENNVPSCFLEIWSPGLEVVGNAHDNPELLK